MELEGVQEPAVGDSAAVASTVAPHLAPPPPPVTMAAAPVAPPIAGIRVPRLLSRISRRYVAVAHTIGGPPFCIFRGVGTGRGGVGGS